MIDRSAKEVDKKYDQDVTQATHKAERLSCWKWSLFILMFFGLQALLWTSAIRLTNKYPSKPIISSAQDHGGSNRQGGDE